VKKLFCIALACSFVLILASCGKIETPVASTDPTEIVTTTEVITTTETLDTTAIEESTTEEIAEETTIEETTTLPGETTTIGETEVATTTTATLKIPSTVAEIVTYYNDAANKVKNAKPGYSFTEQTNINSIFGGAQWLVNIVNRAITDETPQAATIAKGANHNDFAVPGKDWASKLNASAVQSATCTEKGGVYEIRINMKREVKPDLPRNVEDHQHGRAFKVYNAGMIYGVMAGYENLGAITKFAPTYRDCYIVCTIDKTTGDMKTAQYYLTFDAEIEGRLVSAIPIRASASISVTGKYVF